ncbi:MAG: hypothetical protein IRY85_11720 [Micromonosporaceae bacterium]|nr:hypothetical protein [Micromonosporaceae bacterium]
MVAVVALLAGCTQLPLGGPGATPTPTSNGVEALEADAILAKATQALAEAESVHVAGTLGEGLFGLTLDLTFQGQDVAGTVNVLGVIANIIRIGDVVYLKADTSLFEQLLPPDQKGSISLLGGKWVRLNLAWVTALVPIPFTADDLVSTTSPLAKGDPTTVGAVPAITLTDADGAVLHVATTGEPYVLDISLEGDRDLSFSRFNEPVTIEAPPDEEIFDLLKALGLDSSA